MPWMLRSPRTWRSSPQPTVLLAPSRGTRRTWCWTSPLISRRERLVRTIEEHHRFLLRLQLDRLEAAEKDLAVLEQRGTYLRDKFYRLKARRGYKRAAVAV